MRYIALALCLLLGTVAIPACMSAPDDSSPADHEARIQLLEQRIAELERELDALREQHAAAEAAPTEAEDTPTETEPEESGGGRQLALPDISLVVQARGKLSDDKLDPDRQKLLLSEAELGIQGYVYPNVKADAFIAGSPAEDEPFHVCEAYLTYLGLSRGLNLYVGKKHVPFGRTGLLHNHSWLYTRQPLVISNFVAEESLNGQGLSLSYLIPTNSSLFAQLELGTWANGKPGEGTPVDEFQDVPPVGPGANMSDRFSTARLWTGYPISENSELELGGSWADGKSDEDPVDRVRLTGLDVSYRHFGEGSKRLLLRGESFWRRGTTDSDGATANGYYLFGNYRWNRCGSLGLLYDWSEFPQATDFHESALSLILTKQFSEQYYLRLQATHGSRPDADPYNELWLQWVWGVGPHTHNLE